MSGDQPVQHTVSVRLLPSFTARSVTSSASRPFSAAGEVCLVDRMFVTCQYQLLKPRYGDWFMVGVI